jgi:hypothetical protein
MMTCDGHEGTARHSYSPVANHFEETDPNPIKITPPLSVGVMLQRTTFDQVVT